MAIVMALQQRAETAQSLAEKLEVSRRTILRDMQSLAEMGIPIYALSGPAGGYRLMEGYTLPPLQLDAEEALTVLFALNALTKLSDSPFQQARWTAADKIRAALPKGVLAKVEPLLTHLEIEIPDRLQKSPFLEKLIQSAASSAWLRVLYRSERQQRWLRLKPHRVYTAHGFWYCEAFSAEHGEDRSFRVDRIRELELAVEPEHEISVPPGEHSSGRVSSEDRISIVAKLTYRGALLAEQDFHFGHLVSQLDDTEWELRFLCPASEWKWTVSFFYSLGMEALVLEPQSLRDELYAMGEKLKDRYAKS